MRYDILFNALLMVIMCLTSVYIFSEYYVYKINDCTATPLQYGANKFQEDYGGEFFGSATFTTYDGKIATISFNATDLRAITIAGMREKVKKNVSGFVGSYNINLTLLDSMLE